MANTNEEVTEIDLLRLAKVLWRRGWILFLAALLGGGVALGGTGLFFTPTYKASVLMYVNSTDISLNGAKASISQGELTAAQSLIDTYTVILKTRTTLNDVIQLSGVFYDYEELSEMITAEAVNDTEVFQIHVESPSPSEAMTIANTIALVLPGKIASIVEGSSARIVDMAVEPTQIESPDYRVNTLLGALLGFAAAAGTVVIRELLDDKIHDGAYVTQTWGLPVLAAVPALPEQQSLGADLPPETAEAYRRLRTNLNFSLPEKDGCRVIGITSAMEKEGKSTTAMNMAYTLAQAGSRVLLLEADLRSPVFGKQLGMKQSPGLSNLLAGQCGGNDVLQRVPLIEGLWLITGGEVPPNPAELLGSRQMKAVLEAMEAVFDVILLDLPPVTVVSDALAVSKLVSGMVLAVRQDGCSRTSLEEALRQLAFVDAKLLGVVMTGISIPGTSGNSLWNPKT